METSYSCDAREDPDESIESIEDIIPHRENSCSETPWERWGTRDDIKKKEKRTWGAYRTNSNGRWARATTCKVQRVHDRCSQLKSGGNSRSTKR